MNEKKEIYIKVTKNGPYLVYGIPSLTKEIIVTDSEGTCIDYQKDKVFEINTSPAAICRCGKSKNAPFCDGSHTDAKFDGTETASFDPISKNSKKYEGENLNLEDNEEYCAFARFCDAHGSIWKLIYDGTKESDEKANEEACLCPAGRLVLYDKEGNCLEKSLEESVALLEDSGLKISGPLWVRGGIRVESADGKSYEIRNRQTLCRCGLSKNKPFCNSAHRHYKFKAKYKKQ